MTKCYELMICTKCKRLELENNLPDSLMVNCPSCSSMMKYTGIRGWMEND